MLVRIYHNAARDPEGRNLGFFGYDPEHPMVLVFAYVSPETDSGKAIEQAFHTFNVGENMLATAYRQRKLRSLSVGDIVACDDTYYSCESLGWITQPKAPRLAEREASTFHGTQPLDG